jgi:POLO box duplicated region
VNANSAHVGSSATTPTPGTPRINGFDAAAETLCTAFDALAQRQLFRDPSDDVDLSEEQIFIASWVDYCNKYGMGYALTDGSVGVHFNDSTTLVLAADKQFVAPCLSFCWMLIVYDRITGILTISRHVDKVRCTCEKTTPSVTIRTS